MCDCLEKVIIEIREDFPKRKGKEVDDIFYSNCGLNFRTGEVQFGMGIDIRFKNQKQLGHTMLNISHCPLCGKKFEE